MSRYSNTSPSIWLLLHVFGAYLQIDLELLTWIFSGVGGWGFLLSQHCTPNQWWFGPSSLEFDLDKEYPNTSWLSIFLLPTNNQSHMIAPKHLCVTPIIRVNFFWHLESHIVGVYTRTYTNHLADSLVEFWWYDYTLSVYDILWPQSLAITK